MVYQKIAKSASSNPKSSEKSALSDPRSVQFSPTPIAPFAYDFTQIPIHSPVIQAKLTIGSPNDRYEQEADRVAAQVVQQLHRPASIQRQDELDETIQAKSMLQRPDSIVTGEASADLSSAIDRQRGGGQALDTGLQQSMGQAMGADFSRVRVHTDGGSDRLNRSIQAQAFTTGQDVFFRKGAYNPGSRGGQELIAHELAHTIQQRGNVIQRELMADAESEQELREMSSLHRELIEKIGDRSKPDFTNPVHTPKIFTKAEMEERERKRPPISAFIGEPYENVIRMLDAADKQGYTRNFRHHPEVLEDFYQRFNSKQFAQVIARLLIFTPGAVKNAGASREEAVRLISLQLQDKEVAKRMVKKGTSVTIVPNDMAMTDLPEFEHLKGVEIVEQSSQKRTWDSTRGLGAKKTAITEENLLGIDTSIGSKYCTGYSTTTHEFAHTLHYFGLDKQDCATITHAYNNKKNLGKEELWTDGKRYRKDDVKQDLLENYASSTESEYFAQAVNAWFGTNKGVDAYTGWERLNGRAWIKKHEPDLTPLLQRLFPTGQLDIITNSSQPLMQRAMIARSEKFRVLYEDDE